MTDAEDREELSHLLNTIATLKVLVLESFYEGFMVAQGVSIHFDNRTVDWRPALAEYEKKKASLADGIAVALMRAADEARKEGE